MGVLGELIANPTPVLSHPQGPLPSGGLSAHLSPPFTFTHCHRGDNDTQEQLLSPGLTLTPKY